MIFVRNAPELRGYIKAHEIPKGILPGHIIQEAYHYTFLGVSPVVAYQTMANMYLMMGDRRGAIESLAQGHRRNVNDPYLRGAPAAAWQGVRGRTPFGGKR